MKSDIYSLTIFLVLILSSQNNEKPEAISVEPWKPRVYVNLDSTLHGEIEKREYGISPCLESQAMAVAKRLERPKQSVNVSFWITPELNSDLEAFVEKLRLTGGKSVERACAARVLFCSGIQQNRRIINHVKRQQKAVS